MKTEKLPLLPNKDSVVLNLWLIKTYYQLYFNLIHVLVLEFDQNVSL